MDICPKLDHCPFFQKYGNDLPDTCQALIRLYCHGSRPGRCQRIDFRQEHGYPPPDDMMPNGDRLLA